MSEEQKRRWANNTLTFEFCRPKDSAFNELKVLGVRSLSGEGFLEYHNIVIGGRVVDWDYYWDDTTSEPIDPFYEPFILNDNGTIAGHPFGWHPQFVGSGDISDTGNWGWEPFIYPDPEYPPNIVADFRPLMNGVVVKAFEYTQISDLTQVLYLPPAYVQHTGIESMDRQEFDFRFWYLEGAVPSEAKILYNSPMFYPRTVYGASMYNVIHLADLYILVETEGIPNPVDQLSWEIDFSFGGSASEAMNTDVNDISVPLSTLQQAIVTDVLAAYDEQGNVISGQAVVRLWVNSYPERMLLLTNPELYEPPHYHDLTYTVSIVASGLGVSKALSMTFKSFTEPTGF